MFKTPPYLSTLKNGESILYPALIRISPSFHRIWFISTRQ